MMVTAVSQAQTNAYTKKSIGEVLDLKWQQSYVENDYSYYFQQALIVDDILIHHFDVNFAIDLASADPLYFSEHDHQAVIKSRIKDSLLVYDLMDKIVIKNIYTGKIFVDKRKYKKFGFNGNSDSPYFLKDSLVIYIEDKNKLFAYNPFKGTSSWQKDFPETVYAFDYYEEDKINLITKTTFYQLSKVTGEVLWSLPIIQDGKSSLNTDLNLKDDKLYLWGESAGINVVNLRSKKIESQWLANGEGAEFTMQIIFESDSIFARTPSNIYCVSQKDGTVYWTSEDVSIRSSLVVHDDYIFFYQRGQENNGDLLAALSRETHQLEYAQFTSKLYPPENESAGKELNVLDLTTIDFM